MHPVYSLQKSIKSNPQFEDSSDRDESITGSNSDDESDASTTNESGSDGSESSANEDGVHLEVDESDEDSDASGNHDGSDVFESVQSDHTAKSDEAPDVVHSSRNTTRSMKKRPRPKSSARAERHQGDGEKQIAEDNEERAEITENACESSYCGCFGSSYCGCDDDEVEIAEEEDAKNQVFYEVDPEADNSKIEKGDYVKISISASKKSSRRERTLHNLIAKVAKVGNKNKYELEIAPGLVRTEFSEIVQVYESSRKQVSLDSESASYYTNSATSANPQDSAEEDLSADFIDSVESENKELEVLGVARDMRAVFTGVNEDSVKVELDKKFFEKIKFADKHAFQKQLFYLRLKIDELKIKEREEAQGMKRKILRSVSEEFDPEKAFLMKIPTTESTSTSTGTQKSYFVYTPELKHQLLPRFSRDGAFSHYVLRYFVNQTCIFDDVQNAQAALRAAESGRGGGSGSIPNIANGVRNAGTRPLSSVLSAVSPAARREIGRRYSSHVVSAPGSTAAVLPVRSVDAFSGSNSEALGDSQNSGAEDAQNSEASEESVEEIKAPTTLSFEPTAAALTKDRQELHAVVAFSQAKKEFLD